MQANIIGSGPNGLAAAITLAQAGVKVTVYERLAHVGGACSSAELTLPGFVHDVGSSAYPMGIASPFFRSLPLERFGLRWLQPEIAFAHPLENGSAAWISQGFAGLSDALGGEDAARWRDLYQPLVERWERLVPEILGPVLHVPRHGLALARFGFPALLSATSLARRTFAGERARALFAGCAAHSVMPLDAPLSAAIGLVLGAAGHTLPAGRWSKAVRSG